MYSECNSTQHSLNQVLNFSFHDFLIKWWQRVYLSKNIERLSIEVNCSDFSVVFYLLYCGGFIILKLLLADYVKPNMKYSRGINVKLLIYLRLDASRYFSTDSAGFYIKLFLQYVWTDQQETDVVWFTGFVVEGSCLILMWKILSPCCFPSSLFLIMWKRSCNPS